MQIIMTRADFEVALAAVKLVAAGMAKYKMPMLSEAMGGKSLDELLANRVEDDGLCTVRYTEEGVVMNMSHEALQKVYDAYHLETFGELIGQSFVLTMQAYEYGLKCKEALEGFKLYSMPKIKKPKTP